MILVEASAPHWVEVANRLEGKGARTVYWTAWKHSRDAVWGAFPNTVFHDTIHAKRGLDAQGREPAGTRFDAACEKAWREDAQVVYDQMNRFDHSRDMSLVERSTLFYRMLVFWRRIVAEHAPDLVVFPAPPHVVYDYVLLCLCRNLGVPTLMFEEATIYPPYCLAMRDFREGSPGLAASARRTNAPSEESLAIARRLRGAYREAKPAREVVAHAARDEALKEGLAGLVNRKNTVEIEESRGRDLEIVNQSSLYKEQGQTLRDSFKGEFAGTRYYKQLIREWKVTRRLNEQYDSLASRDLEGPAVYVPLAGQPERTSNPQADLYANQLLMVNALAHAVPPGWSVWVKEHPNQFHPQFAVNMCRSEEYYLALASIPGVRIVPIDSDPFETIDKATMIATTGGTSALEAVARGKPALLFGDAWYRDCPGVHRIRSAGELAGWMARHGEHLVLDPAAFESYVESIRAGCFRGLGDYPPDGYPMDAEENHANLARVVENALAGRELLEGIGS
ncbi:MAG: hypothetical protein KIS74_04480 [Burkholderiales bacterium]|nr:hypothetical protein [Burkholderiales bacterium]